MGAHTPLQSVITQEKGSGRALGQGPGVMEEECSMKNEKTHEKVQFIVNYIKRNPRMSLFSSFCKSAKMIPFVACLQHMVQQTDL